MTPDPRVEVLQRIDRHPAREVHLLTPGCGNGTSLPVPCARICTA